MRSVIAVGCVLVALGVLTHAGQSRPGPGSQPPSGTRVAVMNLQKIVKDWKKYKKFQEHVKGEYQRYEKHITEAKAQIEELTKGLTSPDLPDEKRKDMEKRIKELQRLVEDGTKEAKEELGAMTDKEMVVIYTEVRDTVESYAKIHGIELVLHYTDTSTEKELNNPMNVARKISSAGCVPIFSAPSIDITGEILAIMNGDKPVEKKPSSIKDR